MDRRRAQKGSMHVARPAGNRFDGPRPEPLCEVIGRGPSPVSGHLVITDHPAQEAPCIVHEKIVRLLVNREDGRQPTRFDRIELLAEDEQITNDGLL